MPGWWKRESESKIPEKFRGLTEEQLVAALEESESLKSKLPTVEASVAEKDTVITQKDSELQTLRTKLQELEANNRRQEPPKKQGDEPIEFLQDPEGAVNQRIRNAVNPVAVAALVANANIAKNNAKQQLDRQRVQGTKLSKGAIWDKYSGDIDKLAKTVTVDQLQTPEAWGHLFSVVLGQHMDEIVSSSRDGKFEEMFVESANDSISRTNDEPRADKPTEEEIKIAQRMKIPIEKYMENKKAMVTA